MLYETVVRSNRSIRTTILCRYFIQVYSVCTVKRNLCVSNSEQNINLWSYNRVCEFSLYHLTRQYTEPQPRSVLWWTSKAKPFGSTSSHCQLCKKSVHKKQSVGLHTKISVHKNYIKYQEYRITLELIIRITSEFRNLGPKPSILGHFQEMTANTINFRYFRNFRTSGSLELVHSVVNF